MRLVVKSAAMMLAEKVIRLGVGLLVSAAVARYLMPEKFGQLMYALALVGAMQTIVMLGFDNILVRDLARGRYSIADYVKTARTLRIVVAFFVFGCGLLFGRALFGVGEREIFITFTSAAFSLFFLNFDVFESFYQSKSQVWSSSLARLFGTTCAATGKLIAIKLSQPVWVFGSMQIIEAGAFAALIWLISRRENAVREGKFNKKIAAELAKEGWPFLLAQLSILIYMRIDQVMLREIRGDKELGIYAASLPLSQAWNFVAVVVSQATIPVMARIAKDNNVAFDKYLKNLFSLMFWIAIFCTVLTWAIGSLAMSMLFGAKYSGTDVILKIHVITNIFIFLGVAQTQWVLFHHRPRISLYKTFFGAITSVVANYFLIPRYGAAGAAASAVLAQATASVLSNAVLAPALFQMQVRSIFSFPRLGLLLRGHQ